MATIVTTTSGSTHTSIGNPVTTPVGSYSTDGTTSPYLREQIIGVFATGMRPNTKLYVFFDGVLMSGTNSSGGSFVTPASLNFALTAPRVTDFYPTRPAGSELYSDSSGNVSFTLHIPPSTFFVGARPVVITDINDLGSLNAGTTVSIVNFNAFNYNITTPDQMVVSTRPVSVVLPTNTDQTTSLPVVSANLTPAFTTANTTGLVLPAGFNLNVWGPFRLDPIAQGFYVGGDGLNSIGGIYVSSVDLYFASKDSTFGVTVDIRTIQNGTPTTTVVPLSSTHVTSSSITVDKTTGQAKTTVNFPAPVFLASGFSYALCITPDGNSPNYTLWTAAVGGEDVFTTSPVTKNWGSGDLFTSTNSETWVPVPNEFLKFTLYTAKFSSGSGSVTVTNKDNEFLMISNTTGQFKHGEYAFQLGASANVFANTLGSNCSTVSNTSLTVTLTSGNTNLSYANGLLISTGGFTAFSDNTAIIVSNGSAYDVLFVSGAPSSSTTMSVKNYPKFSGSVSMMVPPLGLVETFDPSMFELVLDNSTSNSSSYFLQSNTTNTYSIVGVTSGATSRIGGIRNRVINRFAPYFHTTTVPSTSLGYSMVNNIRYTYANTVSKSYDLTSMNYFVDNEVMVASKTNEIINNSGVKSLSGTFTLSSSSNTVSPSIDLQNMSLLGFKNIVNPANNIFNENTKLGTNRNKYISKTITLANGLDSEDLVVYLSAYKPLGTYINVYGKFLGASDPETFDSKDWTLLTQITSNTLYSDSVNLSDVKEYQFTVPSSPPTVAKTGILSVTSGANTVTGTGTTFTVDSPVGSLVKVYQDSTYTTFNIVKVTAVSSDTSLSVDTNFTFTGLGCNYQVVTTPKTAYLNGNNSGLIRYYGSTGVAYDNFITYAIKIDLASDYSYLAPRVLNVRSVAATV